MTQHEENVCPFCTSTECVQAEGKIWYNANRRCQDCNRYFCHDEHGSRPAMVRQ
jgi:transposase-like protein